MSWIFNFVKDTLSNSSDFVRSIIGYSAERRTQSPETLQNEIRRREKEEANRQEEVERIQQEERQRQVVEIEKRREARRKTLAERKAMKDKKDLVTIEMKSDKRFQKQKRRSDAEFKKLQRRRRELFAYAAERRRLRIVPNKRRRLLSNVIQHLEIRNPFPNPTLTFFLERSRHLITKFLGENPNNKIRISVVTELAKNTTGEASKATFWSSKEIILKSTDINKTFDRMKAKIIEALVKYAKNGSGWFVVSVEKIQIDKSSYDPLRGSSHIPLPKKISDKKALINMENKDDMCFKYAVTRALNPVSRDAERITKVLKKQASELNWNGIEFPTPCAERQLKTFEKNNNVSVLVFGHEGNDIFPLYVPTDRRKKVVRLFFQKTKTNSHYSVIKSMSRLVASQMSTKQHKKYVCDFCLNAFGTEDLLLKHEEYCREHDCVNTTFPKPGENILKFKNFQNASECPINIFADYESFLEPIDKTHGKTKLYQQHVPSAFCLYVVSRVTGFSMDPITYGRKGSENVAEVFVEKLDEVTKKIYDRFKDDATMIFNDEARKLFEEQTECYACGKPFSDEEDGLRKFRDHCHFTGRFRGALHSKCNLRLRKTKVIPVFFHNLEGYDSHLFVKHLADTEGSVNCIPHNEEKYITFTKNVWVDVEETKDGGESNIFLKLKFLDTMHFMASSLEKLVNNLEPTQFKHTFKYFQNEKLSLMLKKGIYPYEYMDSQKKLLETQLPSIEKFYSSLSGSGISDKDYEHAKNVWKTFGCKTLSDYTELYCKSDVLLLTDVFEDFIDVSLKKYGLDPSHYITSPSLAFDAMLKMTKVKLELLTDPDMYLFFERGVRGGVSMITKRYAKANNKYMGADYDPTKPSVYLPYLDANNLYGWAISQPLPVSRFQWLSEEEILKMTNDHSKIQSCHLEVDLEYLDHLHDAHNDYPLAPEQVEINKVKKLIPHLGPRKNYIVHHGMLQQILKRGLVLTKIHQGIKYEESEFLSEYIDSNTKSRTKAKSDFEKDFFKLMNNSVFGKTMENIRKRCTVEIVNGLEEKEVKKLIAEPNYKSSFIFANSNLVSMRIGKTKVELNKPVYLGASILDLSKILMYDFHYDYIILKYGNRAQLLFTDTDSLCYELWTDDFFVDIAPDVETMFDRSNFPKEHPSCIPTGKNKKVIGLFKEENGGEILLEFCGLRAKCYATKMHDGTESKKCKGVKKAVVKKGLTIEDYKTCLFEVKPKTISFNTLRSRKHEITTETITKIALAQNDDKRVVCEERVNTLAIGHYKTKV